MMKCINSTIYKGLISEGISFQLLSTTCCKTYWWRNFLLVVAQLGWSSLRNSFFKQFTHHSLWNCLVTHYKTRLLLGWKIHSSQNLLVTRCKEYNFNLHFASVRIFMYFDKVLYFLILEPLHLPNLNNMYNFWRKIYEGLLYRQRLFFPPSSLRLLVNYRSWNSAWNSHCLVLVMLSACACVILRNFHISYVYYGTTLHVISTLISKGP